MKNVVYRWYLSADGGTTKQRVYPIYKGDLAIEYELESGQQFHRAKLSGKIDFVGTDYDWIMSQDLAIATIQVYLQVSYDNLATKQLYWQGHFTLTDMEVNADDKRIVVQPQASDRYSTLLDGIETEYDIIRDLAPSKSTIRLIKGAYMQIITEKGLTSSYIVNDYVDDIRGLDTFQEDCINDFDASAFKFGVIGNVMSAILSKSSDSNGDMPAIDAEGTYVGMYNSDTQYAELYCPDNDYYISYQYALDGTTQTLQLHDENGVVLYAMVVFDSTPISAFQYNLSLLATESTMVGKFAMSTQAWSMYGRLMTDTDNATITIGGSSVSVQDRPVQDLTNYSLNYKKVVQLSNNYMGYIAVSARTSATEIPNKTIYGRNSNGEYWLPPTDNQLYMPISQTTWQGKVSLWAYALGNNIEVQDAQKDYTLNDAYHIADVISSLLEKINPSITHAATTDYSQFLYGQNPISQTNERLFLTPKSNILSSEYSQAAQKGIITLKMVLDMLAKVYQCFWWIDASNRLRIEHIAYFMQGKSYTQGATASVGIDLTIMLNTRNEKAWDFGKNQWTYEKADMPERIMFKWMDEDVSSVFAGKPIVLQSPFIEKAKKDEQSISNFTSDIDRMLIIPNEFTKDGFALLTATNINAYEGNTYTFNAGSEKSLLITAGEAGTEITFVIEASNTSGQPQPIEYGYYLGEYNKRGDLASMATPVTNTITFVAPSSSFGLYFRSGNTGYTNSVKIVSITGGNAYEINYETLAQDGIAYDVQNYHLSLEYLLPMFWKYNLPCSQASFNGQAAISTSLLQKNRTQQVKFPVGAKQEPDAELLVRTDVGDGSIRKMSVPLSSRVATANLKQDTIEYVAPIIVTPPTLSVASGEVTLNTQLTIGISGNAVSAEYSTDGETWTEYEQSITLTQDVTIYARAKDASDNTSDVVSAEYEVLPYETEIEYLQGTGTQYIETGITASADLRTKIKTSYQDVTMRNNSVMGCRTSSAYPNTRYWINYDGHYEIGYGGYKATSVVAVANQPIEIDFNYIEDGNHSFKFDTTTITYTGTPTTSNTIILFGRKDGTNIVYGASRIYYVQFILDGNLIGDLIPVRVGTTGYMYDRVSKTLFGNAGTGDFTLGNDVN